MKGIVLGPLSPELRGYIAELQAQIEVLSARAAMRTADLFAAREELELLKGQLRAQQTMPDESKEAHAESED